MIQIDNLQVNKNGTTICRVAQLSIERGGRVGILGLNGSGKTTLLRVLAELEHNFTGKCQIGVPRKQRVYVHQNPYLFRGTVLQNVMYGLRAQGGRRAANEKEALYWIDKLEIGALAARKVNHLSGGEQRRVALARAIALKPSLLLLDEPLAEMDEPATVAVVRALGELKETTILIATPTDLPAGLTEKSYRLEAD